MKIIVLFFLMILMSCATQFKDKNTQNNLESFDHIKLGDNSEAVKNKVGQAQSESHRHSDEFTWYYLDENIENFTKAMITFDAKKKNVQEMVFFQKESEKNNNLNYFLHIKFKDLKFENLRKTTCKGSFYSNYEYYINKSEGLFIEYNMRQKFVKYYAYRSIEEIEEFIRVFNECKLRIY